MAVANYRDTEGHYPPAFIRGPDGRPWHSWRVLVLPFMEAQDLYEAYDFAQPWNGPDNRLLADRMPRMFAFSHGRKTPGITNYLAVVGPETAWPGARIREDMPADTVMIVENLGANIPWMEPRDLDFATMDFTLGSPNGVSSVYDRTAVLTASFMGTRLLDHGTTPERLRGMFLVDGPKTPVGEPLPDGRDRPLRVD